MKILSAFVLALLLAALAFTLIGHTGIPKGQNPVQNFEISRYLGTWYEIARLDHGFEKGLSHVTAEYSLRDDGGIKVINKGFNDKKGQWEESEAKAYPIDSPGVGRLKVSFFGPFYGSYNILELDEKNYSYALVTGPSLHYLWILSRQKTIDPIVMQNLVQKAKGLGFKLDKLIYVDQKDLPANNPALNPTDNPAK